MSAMKKSPIAAATRLWFSVTPQERRLLFGIAVLLLLGLTLRHFHLRSQAPTPTDPPAGEAIQYGKEPVQ